MEVVPAGPKAVAQAEAVRVRLLNEVDERRHPRTSATVDQLLDRHFALATWEPTTRDTYVGYAKRHIRPLIGAIEVGALEGDVFDSFYAELRRCASIATDGPTSSTARLSSTPATSVRSARVHPAGWLQHPAGPFHPQRRLDACRAMAVDWHQPGTYRIDVEEVSGPQRAVLVCSRADRTVRAYPGANRTVHRGARSNRTVCALS